MTIRRILILIPTLVILFLLQSYLWVPTYEEQTKGNPNRLHEYITASTGDATSLNPTISSNSTSSQIESLVFDSLLDRDEELRFRGRLATSWEISEEAYFYLNPQAVIPGVGSADAEEVVRILREAKKGGTGLDPGLKATLNRIKEIMIIPPEKVVETRHYKAAKEDKEEKEIEVIIQAPPGSN